MSNNKKCKSRA